MKTKIFPQFHIDGRRARTLRKELGMPDTLDKLDENTRANTSYLPES
jgi:hypothetical protein